MYYRHEETTDQKPSLRPIIYIAALIVVAGFMVLL